MDFRFIHVYRDSGSVDARAVADEIAKVFPNCRVDVRPPFFELAAVIDPARISDTKQPFEKQPMQKAEGTMPLYDGFVVQRLLAETIPDAEMDHVHVVLTDVMTCTFSEDDWRYHGRAVICGTPSIVSTAGIVEAPAKPKEFYLAQFATPDINSLKRRFAGRFIDYGDNRMTPAASSYALQALFFFVAAGEPFCDDTRCRLFNAHWQEDLIRTLDRPALCSRHQKMANKFNREIGNH